MTASYQSRLQVESWLESLTDVQAWFDGWCKMQVQECPWIAEHSYAMSLLLAEGFTNVVRHAHAELDSATPIELEVNVNDDCIELEIWDRGREFNPDELPQYDPECVNMDDPATGGYGWFLLRKLSDVVTYRRHTDEAGARNCLRIVKYARSPHANVPQSEV
ncbi:MAG: ATP-binding protein [Cyanobacteria bacterium J06639_1]